MKVAVYNRVSTEEQVGRDTIQNQIDFAMKYCDLHQLDIYKLYKEDGISGTIPLHERQEGKALIEDAKNKKFDTLLVYKLDRLGRSARVTLNSIYELESYGIQIKSMTEPFDTSNPSGRFMITMLAGVADLERETILERMWHGANRAARDGKWLGGIVPYGYYVDENKHLQINNEIIPNINMSEADIVRLIFDMVANKGYSTIKLADYLNAMKIPTHYSKDHRGKVANIWRPNNIGRMLRNTTYKGVHIYGKRSKKQRECIERHVPFIVDEDIWDRSQNALKNNQNEAMRNSKRTYLLRSLIKCGECGMTYQGNSYNRNNNSTDVYYVCGGKKAYKGPQGKCTSKNLPAAYIENMVWNDIVRFINSPGEAIDELQNNINKTKEETKNIELDMNILKRNIKEKESEKQSILDLFRKKLIDAKDVEQQLEKIHEEKENLQRSLDELEESLNSESELTKKFNSTKELLKDLKGKIDGDVTFEVKRNIIKTLVKKIIIKTNSEGRNKSASVEIKYSFVNVVTRTDKDS